MNNISNKRGAEIFLLFSLLLVGFNIFGFFHYIEAGKYMEMWAPVIGGMLSLILCSLFYHERKVS